MKTCNVCGVTKPHDEFDLDRGKLRAHCKPCRREKVNARYREKEKVPRPVRDKALHVQRVMRTQASKRQRIHEAKSVPCSDCGITYPYYVMDFDHVRGVKSFNFGANGIHASWKDLEAEIAKCDVVCANCHRQRTHERAIAKKGIL